MRRHPVNHIVRRQQRYDEATERQKERDKRSNREQLAILDKRLGKGKGARKERKQLKA